ncbi:MAG: hypothetical protein AAGL49_01620, partial [Pseudomonadota bacterium]
MTDETESGASARGRIFFYGTAGLIALLFLAVGVRFLSEAGRQGGPQRTPTPVVAAVAEAQEFVDIVEAIGTIRAAESVSSAPSSPLVSSAKISPASTNMPLSKETFRTISVTVAVTVTDSAARMVPRRKSSWTSLKPSA